MFMKIFSVCFVSLLITLFILSCAPLSHLRESDQFKEVIYHKSGDTVDYHRVFYPPTH